MLELWFRQFADEGGWPAGRAPARARPSRRRAVRRGVAEGSRLACAASQGLSPADGLRAEERARLPRMRDVIAHRGPDEAGAWFDDHAALGHRRLSIVDLATGSQPLAQRRRHDPDRLQRRDLQPRRPAPRARGRRPSLSHALRHRGDRPRLRAVGRRLRAPLPRHVRVRDLGRPAPAAAARARSAGHQAALLDRPRRPADLRLRDQGHSRQRPGRAAGERERPARAARHALSLRRGDALQGHPQAAARAPARVRAGTRHDAAVLGRSRRSGGRERRRRTDASGCHASARCSRNRCGCG